MTAPEPPVYWSPTKGVLQVSASGFGYSQLAGHTSVRELPSDAVRLVPAAAPTPTDDDELPALAKRIEDAAGASMARWHAEDLRAIAANLRAVLARRTEETETDGR